MPKRTFQLLYPKKIDDEREVTVQDIDEILKNTSSESRYSVSLGHARALGFFDDHHEAAGTMTNLRKDEDNTLLGDVDLQPEVDEAYKTGKYPGWSVGITPPGSDGRKMDHLALLGSVGAAFKDLQELGGDAFSIHSESAQGMTIECFESKKTLWLLQSTPKGPEIPKAAAPSKPSNKGDQKMSQELKDTIAAQKTELETFRADNDRLKADAQTRADAEATRRGEQFATIKVDLVKAAADKGVTEPARDEFKAALDAYDVHYAAGIVSPELFAAMTKVISELKPKVDPGELPAGDPDADDDFVPKTNFSAAEATAAILE